MSADGVRPRTAAEMPFGCLGPECHLIDPATGEHVGTHERDQLYPAVRFRCGAVGWAEMPDRRNRHWTRRVKHRCALPKGHDQPSTSGGHIDRAGRHLLDSPLWQGAASSGRYGS